MPHVVQTEADKVFVNVYNAQAVSVSDGDVLVWATTSADGVKTTQAAAATLSMVVGIADGSIAASAYGLAQSYGYKSAALISNDTAAVAVGDILLPIAAQDHLYRYASGGDVANLGTAGIIAAATVATAATAAATSAVFLRLL
jgi:hypothetical protein